LGCRYAWTRRTSSPPSEMNTTRVVDKRESAGHSGDLGLT
jgi:hypothetical protein